MSFAAYLVKNDEIPFVYKDEGLGSDHSGRRPLMGYPMENGTFSTLCRASRATTEPRLLQSNRHGEGKDQLYSEYGNPAMFYNNKIHLVDDITFTTTTNTAQVIPKLPNQEQLNVARPTGEAPQHGSSNDSLAGTAASVSKLHMAADESEGKDISDKEDDFEMVEKEEATEEEDEDEEGVIVDKDEVTEDDDDYVEV